MEKENVNVNVSCWKNEDKSASLVEDDHVCPLCKGQAQQVKGITVEHFVSKSNIDELDKYYICLSENCDMVYFNSDNKTVFNKDSIKIPIWFKKDADPKYICYCNKVTEKQIIDAVLKEEAKNMKDIIKITGAMKNAECERKNPLSKCCGPIIQDIINKTLNRDQ